MWIYIYISCEKLSLILGVTCGLFWDSLNKFAYDRRAYPDKTYSIYTYIDKGKTLCQTTERGHEMVCSLSSVPTLVFILPLQSCFKLPMTVWCLDMVRLPTRPRMYASSAMACGRPGKAFHLMFEFAAQKTWPAANFWLVGWTCWFAYEVFDRGV